MNFLCPACRTPLPHGQTQGVVPCTRCGVQVDLTRLDTAPGTARLWPDLDLTGESLGEYRLDKRLAAGGMGVVYEAEGPKGPCAVKVLSALLAAEPELRTRFRREAAALRAIEHPGVVRILAEGEERGFSWYAMERVDGPDLRARIAQGALAAGEVEALARRLLESLATVHAKGFVHRDIKPANILMAASGPKLCDFGIARFDGSSTLTESAAVLGSLRYMSPEQRLGRCEARSDLYSLGIVLHEALAKGVPGEANLPRSVPARLRRLVTRLLSERADDRPADARAAIALLNRRSPGAATLGAGATAVVAIAAGIAYVVATGGPPAAATKGGEQATKGLKNQVEQQAALPNKAEPPPQNLAPTNDNADVNSAGRQGAIQAIRGTDTQPPPKEKIVDVANALGNEPQAIKPEPPKPQLVKTLDLGKDNSGLGTKGGFYDLGTKGKPTKKPKMTYEEQREAALRAKLGANYDKYMAKMAEEANSKDGQVQADKVAAEKPREPVTPSPQAAPKGTKAADDFGEIFGKGNVAPGQGGDATGGKPAPSKIAKDDAVASPDNPAATQADDGPKQVPQKKSAPRTKGKKADPASTPEERTGK